jgi:hypothetical protein
MTSNIIRTFIDVGGIFAGISHIEIYKYLKDKFQKDMFLCYFDQNDKPKKYTEENANGVIISKIYDWNNEIESDDNHYYYYDHRHTTGTDAKIPINTKGIALLGTKDRHRDVLQAIYRMRKLKNGGHNIIFALNSKTEKIIPKIAGKNDKNNFDMYHDIYISIENRLIFFNGYLVFKSYNAYLDEQNKNKKTPYYASLWENRNIYK